MKLYFSRNPNPRLAVATARFLDAPVVFEFASPFAPDQQQRFRRLNPNLSIPILEFGDGTSLWEADAIACRLSRDTGSDFWRTGNAEPDMIRWLSWAMWNFVRAADKVHFERGTKQRYGLGPVRQDVIEDGLSEFRQSAIILDAELERRDWILADGISYADFRMATFLPFNDVALLPLADFPNVATWYGRLMKIDAWRDPFAGLEAPELPPVKG